MNKHQWVIRLLMNIIKKNSITTVIGAPWEVYVTDPMVEKDTAKWQTDIYYPVQ
jgi:effector-binding domain-containing protein